MEYRLISAKATRIFSGSLQAAIEAAKAMDDELQPAFGITVEDAEGNTIAEVRDGSVEEE